MTVAWLALRELWISYRLMIVVGGFIAGGAIVALVPLPSGLMTDRLAVVFAVATALAGMVSAWSLATARRRRRAAWLVGHGVTRATIVMSWFAALGLAGLLGLVPSAALAWPLVAPAAPSEGAAYAATIAAIGGGVLVAVALGLVAGAILPPGAAAAVTLVAWAGAAAGTWLSPDASAYMPGAGLALLAELGDTARPIARALAATGVALGAAAALLVLAAAAFERVDL
jgi:hypothetical protein